MPQTTRNIKKERRGELEEVRNAKARDYLGFHDRPPSVIP